MAARAERLAVWSDFFKSPAIETDAGGRKARGIQSGVALALPAALHGGMLVRLAFQGLLDPGSGCGLAEQKNSQLRRMEAADIVDEAGEGVRIAPRA